MNQLTGLKAEQLASDYLVRQGLLSLQTNYHCRRGEIDLIMRHQEVLVFVEVRYRKNNLYGSALESITPSKQRKIGLAARQFINQYGMHNQPCRFDVVAISGSTMESINWLTDAFQPEL